MSAAPWVRPAVPAREVVASGGRREVGGSGEPGLASVGVPVADEGRVGRGGVARRPPSLAETGALVPAAPPLTWYRPAP